MPSKHTFLIKPIAALIEEEMPDNEIWIDPFAGYNSPAALRNDLNPDAPTEFHEDALDFLRSLPGGGWPGMFYDPPYSMRQAAECYSSHGKDKLTGTVTSMTYWANVKNRIGELISPGGKVISCGWSSMGMGINRGFKMTRVLLVPHGGSRNDTIVTVEIKV